MDRHILASLLDIAYEIASGNDEGLTDSDEAIRIYSERYDNRIFTPAEVAEWNGYFYEEFGDTSEDDEHDYSACDWNSPSSYADKY
jgi:hypothetical protein